MFETAFMMKIAKPKPQRIFLCGKVLKIFLSGNKGFVYFSPGSINLHSSPGTGQGSGVLVGGAASPHPLGLPLPPWELLSSFCGSWQVLLLPRAF